LLVYWLLTAIGFAVGGIGLRAFTFEDLSTLTIGAVIWQSLAIVVALLTGSFVAVKSSRGTQYGVGEGMVTSSLFFWTMALQVGVMVASITGSTAGMVASGVQGMSIRPELQSFFEDELSALQLKGDPVTVIEGVALRFAINDFDSARNYLARNSNLSESAIDESFVALRTRYNQAVERVREATGKAMAYAGWIASALFVLGTLAAIFGGSIAARTNRKYPLAEVNEVGRAA
jgi:hypothetical protein